MTSKHIDSSTLNMLLDSVGGDLEFLGELLETFFEDTPDQFSAMHTALDEGDSESFRRAAHSLKSNSASFGALHLSALCRQLEEAGKTGKLAPAAPLLEEAEQEYARVKTDLEDILHGD